jgi:hypothetical protein
MSFYGFKYLLEVYCSKKICDLLCAEVENALCCSCVREAEGHVQTYINLPVALVSGGGSQLHFK